MEEWRDVMVHRFSVRYASSPEGGVLDCVEWLRGFLNDGMECLRVLVEDTNEGGYQIQRVRKPAINTLNVLKKSLEDGHEEVHLRAGELAGMQHYLRRTKKELKTSLVKVEADRSTAEQNLLSNRQQVRELKDTNVQLQRENRQLDEAIKKLAEEASMQTMKYEDLQEKYAFLVMQKEEKYIEEETKEEEKNEKEKDDKECQECPKIREQLNGTLLRLEAAIANERKTYANLKHLQQQYGLVDSYVEDLKQVISSRFIPQAFHRCSAHDTKWIFGTRKISLHPAGKNVIAVVGGGYIPLRDFILRSGEAEKAKERRRVSAPTFPTPPPGH